MADDKPTGKLLVCSECSTVLATQVEIDSRPWLVVGGLQLYAAHGRCVCGKEWHWTASEVRLGRIVEQAKRSGDSCKQSKPVV